MLSFNIFSSEKRFSFSVAIHKSIHKRCSEYVRRVIVKIIAVDDDVAGKEFILVGDVERRISRMTNHLKSGDLKPPANPKRPLKLLFAFNATSRAV